MGLEAGTIAMIASTALTVGSTAYAASQQKGLNIPPPPKAPKAPAPPQLAPPIQTPQPGTSKADQKAQEAIAGEIEEERKRQNRRSTIITGGGGISGFNTPGTYLGG